MNEKDCQAGDHNLSCARKIVVAVLPLHWDRPYEFYQRRRDRLHAHGRSTSMLLTHEAEAQAQARFHRECDKPAIVVVLCNGKLRFCIFPWPGADRTQVHPISTIFVVLA
jgi:hypothetical protein